MSEKNVKIRIVLTFATMLILAMLLQSIVVLFLGVRTSIREDVTWARQVLHSYAIADIVHSDSGATSGGKLGQILSSWPNSGGNEMFSCIKIDLIEIPTAGQSQCRFPDELRDLSQQAREQKKTIVGFAGAGWNIFLFRSEVVIISVPLIDKAGQVYGGIAAERSLLPIFSRYEQDLRIALCYLLVNALIFCSLMFFRISHLFFRPLEHLVQKAETYRPDEQTLFLVGDNESPFRKLSTSLNTLFERIERDNRTLRQNVIKLEGVNAELKEKNELVVRSEKLATAGRLSAGLAHEIGNPLSIIQGYVELLGRADLSTDEKNKFSERAQQELDRIKRLIKQLLDFSRPIDSKIEAQSVNTLIKDVISFVSVEKNFSACSIKTKLLIEDDTIVVDKDALRQVLINCIFNAVDATSAMQDADREIVISTSQEQTEESEPLLVIYVLDNGMGIAEEQLQYLFDPFFTTKEVGRGTGLGLFVCHTLMERLNGTISLCNRDCSGVQVRITLPLQ